MTRHGLNERLQAFVAYVCPPESMRVLRIKSLWWGRYGMAGVSRLREATAAEGVEAIGVYLQVCVCVCVCVCGCKITLSAVHGTLQRHKPIPVCTSPLAPIGVLGVK